MNPRTFIENEVVCVLSWARLLHFRESKPHLPWSHTTIDCGTENMFFFASEWCYTNLSAAVTKLDEQSALKSGSDFSRKNRSSFTMERMLLPLTSAKQSSIDRLEMKQESVKHSVGCTCLFSSKPSNKTSISWPEVTFRLPCKTLPITKSIHSGFRTCETPVPFYRDIWILEALYYRTPMSLYCIVICMYDTQQGVQCYVPVKRERHKIRKPLHKHN